MFWICLKGICIFTLLKGIRSQDTLLRLTNRRLYIGPHGQEHLADLVAEWEKRLTRWCHAASLAGGGDAFAERNGAGAGEQPYNKGAA